MSTADPITENADLLMPLLSIDTIHTDHAPRYAITDSQTDLCSKKQEVAGGLGIDGNIGVCPVTVMK
jgi:hypothetical protein